MVYTGESSRFSEPMARNPDVLLGKDRWGKVGRVCSRGSAGVCTAGGQEVPGKLVLRMEHKIGRI